MHILWYGFFMLITDGALFVQLSKHKSINDPSGTNRSVHTALFTSTVHNHTERCTVSNCAFNAFRNDAAAVKYEVAMRPKPVM